SFCTTVFTLTSICNLNILRRCQSFQARGCCLATTLRYLGVLPSSISARVVKYHSRFWEIDLGSASSAKTQTGRHPRRHSRTTSKRSARETNGLGSRRKSATLLCLIGRLSLARFAHWFATDVAAP